MSKSLKLKGQVSFEFIIIIAIILIIVFAIMGTFYDESIDSFILTSVKQTAENQIAQKSLIDSNCIGAYVNVYSYLNGVITIKTKCAINSIIISNLVEKEICNTNPTGDSIVTCGLKTYSLTVTTP